jgi:membrane protease YdiL (CAAX protease family)
MNQENQENQENKENPEKITLMYLFWLLVFWIIGYTPFVLSSFGVFSPMLAIIFMILGGGSPTLAAVATLGKLKKEGLDPSMVFKGFNRKTDIGKNMILGFLLAISLHILSNIAWILFEGSTVFNIGLLQFNLLIGFFINNLIQNIWEEIGWRGFLLPLLQEKNTIIVSNLILGVIWSLWHIPLYFYAGSLMPLIYGNFAIFIADTILISLIYGYLYNRSNGNLWPVTIFHVTMNSVGQLLLGGRVMLQSPFYLLILNMIFAIVIILK